jgi:hypothetical protein
VPYHVGQRLGHDAIRGDLHSGRQFGQRRGNNASERRSEAVVQIPPEPAALLLQGVIICSREERKLLSERNRLDGRRNRGADQVQDLRVAGINPGLSRAQPDDKFADDLAALAQWRCVAGGRRVSVGGDSHP